jgi:hypothetical protein
MQRHLGAKGKELPRVSLFSEVENAPAEHGQKSQGLKWRLYSRGIEP